MNFKFSKKIILAALATVLCAAGLAYYLLLPRESIVDYQIARDKKFILSLFDKDWYWLSGYSREEANTDVFLEHLSPSIDPLYAGKLTIKVMYADKQPTGFVAYYMKSAHEGTILFIDVAHTFRRRHYGRVLLDYAVDELHKKGARIVRLVTRPQNIPAQTLYKRAGFKEYMHDDTYSFFEKRLS
jgi:ribosomal protein S18 acetylase RimI-like enzyme